MDWCKLLVAEATIKDNLYSSPLIATENQTIKHSHF